MAQNGTGTPKRRNNGKKANVEMRVQFEGKDMQTEVIEQRVIADYKAKTGKNNIRDLKIYIVTEENAAYYVADGAANAEFKVAL